MVTKKTAGRKVAKKKIRSIAITEKIVSQPAKYPRNAVDRSLRIPKAILEQNAGKPCSVKESAAFLGVGAAGTYQVEVSSGIKYGFLERPSPGLIAVAERAKRVLRPQDPQDKLEGLREAVLNAPVISDVYGHYRGENLPDSQFFHNALTDTFGVPVDKVVEFQDIFIESLRAAELLIETDGKLRIIDVSQGSNISGAQSPTLKKLEKAVKVDASDSCFVMMPFAPPLGDYYAKIYKPAIEKAGLRPVRADAEIFGTGKIIDQIWAGINSAKVLVAELTARNPNVFYELGLAHALEKPVVLVSSNEADIPFDLKHIRVIYYDMADPFWGGKLLDKVAENILSAIEHPEEAVLKRTL
ncbi:nucleoside 2-deoxyribosyltransferase [Paraburkholderia sartisoli]|uniref:Uncharacterized protein n=1 Tax=Paraburkholderia sartisoli TaxID=83784 RepID=A0A1H4A4H0_9BURK|nr:nucleoside 2-deoxyribosyltransferase [Paraburkholderia sartisoli]SEA30770.1 hypothetical protein SAMN05192564_1011023 [Paraburkholderia sartisoli]